MVVKEYMSEFPDEKGAFRPSGSSALNMIPLVFGGAERSECPISRQPLLKAGRSFPTANCKAVLGPSNL